MYMRRCLLHQQGGELEQEDPHSIRCTKGILWVDDTVDENADDILIIILVRRRGPTNEFISFPFLKGVVEAWDQHILQDLQEKKPQS